MPRCKPRITGMANLMREWELNKRSVELDAQHAASMIRLIAKTNRRKAVARAEVNALAATITKRIKPTAMKAMKIVNIMKATNAKTYS